MKHIFLRVALWWCSKCYIFRNIWNSELGDALPVLHSLSIKDITLLWRELKGNISGDLYIFFFFLQRQAQCTVPLVDCGGGWGTWKQELPVLSLTDPSQTVSWYLTTPFLPLSLAWVLLHQLDHDLCCLWWHPQEPLLPKLHVPSLLHPASPASLVSSLITAKESTPR